MPAHRSCLVLSAALLGCPALAGDDDRSGFFSLPGTATRLRVYGTLQLTGQYGFDQTLYDNGALLGGDTDPLDASSTPDRQFTMTARTSLFGVRSLTPTAALGEIETRLELGFDGGDPSHNGRPKLNQAWIGVRRWTLGYTTSNWLDLDASPETVDSSGPIGNACSSRGSFTQVRYKLPLGPRTGLSVSLEQNQLAHKGFGAAEDPNQPDGDRASLIKPDARYPSVVAAGTFRDAWGHLGLRLLTQNYGAYQPAAPGVGAVRPNRWASAVQLSGHLDVGREKLVGSIYTGQAVGYYGYNAHSARFDMVHGRVDFQRSTGWQAGYTHPWNEAWRSNLILTGLQFRNDPAVVRDTDVCRAENLFVNTFVKLHKNFEAGLEYGFERLRTFGADAVVQRDGSTGDTNRSSKLQVSLTAKF